MKKASNNDGHMQEVDDKSTLSDRTYRCHSGGVGDLHHEGRLV